MALLTAHKVLIAATIAFGAFLFVFGVARFASDGRPGDLFIGVLGLVSGIAFALYLRWFLRKRATMIRR